LIFLCGRLFAYLVLGYLAGLSAAILRRFAISGLNVFLKPLGGVIIIVLGILILFAKEPSSLLAQIQRREGIYF